MNNCLIRVNLEKLRLLQLIATEPKLQISSVKTKYLAPFHFAIYTVNVSQVEHFLIFWDTTFISVPPPYDAHFPRELIIWKL